MKSLCKSSVVACVALLALSASVAFAADEKKTEKKDAPKPINKICPVEGGEVDPSTAIDYKGKTIAFCCAGCDKEFEKEPAKYMAIIDKELKAEADKSKDKDKKDEKKDDAAKKQDKEPKLNKKCPVTGDDADKALTTEYKGRTIAFCCEDCIKDFKKDPKKYMAKLEKEEADAKKDEKKDGKKDAK